MNSQNNIPDAKANKRQHVNNSKFVNNKIDKLVVPSLSVEHQQKSNLLASQLLNNDETNATAKNLHKKLQKSSQSLLLSPLKKLSNNWRTTVESLSNNIANVNITQLNSKKPTKKTVNSIDTNDMILQKFKSIYRKKPSMLKSSSEKFAYNSTIKSNKASLIDFNLNASNNDMANKNENNSEKPFNFHQPSINISSVSSSSLDSSTSLLSSPDTSNNSNLFIERQKLAKTQTFCKKDDDNNSFSSDTTFSDIEKINIKKQPKVVKKKSNQQHSNSLSASYSSASFTFNNKNSLSKNNLHHLIQEKIKNLNSMQTINTSFHSTSNVPLDLSPSLQSNHKIESNYSKSTKEAPSKQFVQNSFSRI